MTYSLLLDDQTLETAWSSLQDVVYSTAKECLGVPTRKHQDWFDENREEILVLPEEKHIAHKAHLVDPKSVSKKESLKDKCSNIQKKLREMHDNWLSMKADEIQNAADRNDMKSFYSGLKEVYGPTRSGTSPLLSADGKTLLTDKESILARWAEHFDGVLNRPSSINNEAIERLPQVPTDETMDNIPSEEEIKKAISLLSSGKSPGSDAIPAEIYKEGGDKLIGKLHELFTLI